MLTFLGKRTLYKYLTALLKSTKSWNAGPSNAFGALFPTPGNPVQSVSSQPSQGYNLFPQPAVADKPGSNGVPSAAFLKPFPGMHSVRSAPSLEEQTHESGMQPSLGGVPVASTSQGLTLHQSMQLPHAVFGQEQPSSANAQRSSDNDDIITGRSLSWPHDPPTNIHRICHRMHAP